MKYNGTMKISQPCFLLNKISHVVDASSSEDEDENDSLHEDPKIKKGSKLRLLLGLDQDPDADGTDEKSAKAEDDDSFFQHEDDSEKDLFNQDIDEETEEESDVDKEVKYIPGMHMLEEKIRSTLNERKALGDRNREDLTPWEKYQLKRKEKRRERKNQSKERKETFKNDTRGAGLTASLESMEKRRVDVSSSTIAEPSTKNELDLILAGDDGMYLFFE